MTTYDIAVPFIALSLGIAAVLYTKWEGARFERVMRERDRKRRPGE